jgi:hypothetical protein
VVAASRAGCTPKCPRLNAGVLGALGRCDATAPERNRMQGGCGVPRRDSGTTGRAAATTKGIPPPVRSLLPSPCERARGAVKPPTVAPDQGNGSTDRRPRSSRVGRLELESGAGRHHRCPACVDGGDDLLGVDALEVDAGGAEVVCPSWRWMMLSGTPSRGELERVRVAQLVPTAATSFRAWHSARLRADPSMRPRLGCRGEARIHEDRRIR